jgi:trimethylamine--corrinoid protein Co-methyltransferase
MSIWSAVLGGAHLLYHGAGWMEGGLTASFEKLVLDVEMLQMIAVTMAPSDVTEAEIRAGLEAIADVPSGGHFFGSPHTLERYERAFYEPLVSNWQNYESWEEAGALTAADRATGVWQEALERYERPALEPEIESRLHAYVDRRKIELRDRDH